MKQNQVNFVTSVVSCRTFTSDVALRQINATLSANRLGSVVAVVPAGGDVTEASVAELRRRTYKTFSSAPWIALVILASLMFVCSTLALCVFCVSWRR